jgi:hypothetical protein
MRVLPFAARMRSACTVATLTKPALSPSHLVGSAWISVSWLHLCGDVVSNRLSNSDGLLLWATLVLISRSVGGCMTRQPRRSRIREIR